MYVQFGRAEPAPRPGGETPGPITSLALTRVLDATTQPFRYVCRILVRTANRGVSIGSGVLISPYHVLTCAHVLYPRQDPRASRNVLVFPGQNGAGGKGPSFRADGWAVSPGWRWNVCRTADEDFAMIRLAAPVASGFWPVEAFEPAILATTAAHLAAYPKLGADNQAQAMYRSRGRIIGAIRIDACTEPTPRSREILTRTLFREIGDNTKLIAHNLDTRPSMSGGPLWTYSDGKLVVFALHAGDIDNGARKKAVLLNSAVRAQIRDWQANRLPPRQA